MPSLLTCRRAARSTRTTIGTMIAEISAALTSSPGSESHTPATASGSVRNSHTPRSALRRLGLTP
jgi:hypothetical protein